MKTILSLVAAALVPAAVSGSAQAQCNQACAPAQQLKVQQVQAAPVVVAAPVYVVPSAPTVQLQVQTYAAPVVVQAAPVYAAPVVQAAPVVVQRQVVVQPVIQKQVIQRTVIQRPAAPQRQRSFSLQRTVIR